MKLYFMINYRIVSVVLGAQLILFSCAPSRFVNTLPKGETQIGASLGGAMVNLFGLTIPTPYSSVVIGHGIRDDITLYGGLHTTALLFNTFQTDLGVTKRLYHSDSSNFWVPDLSGSFTLNTLFEMKDYAFDVFPQMDLNAVWKYGSKRSNFFYIGASNWFDLSKYKAHEELQTNAIIFNPHIGNTWQKKNWSLTLEYKVLGVMQSNQDIVVDYAKWHGNHSVPGIFVGFLKKINK
ncbi:MAG: hypothetical protein CMP67_03850 [Flavobacteriales bacterium]|nr:hypothetical protein [Flavobacteriales bacterium]